MANPDELKRATNGWSSPLVVREYDADKRGRQAFEEEARTLLLRGGYAAEGQTVDGGHIHAGRLILTGGFSILAGRRGIRSKGKLTVTFKKLGGPPTDLLAERAATRRGADAITEVAGRRPARDSYPVRLLANVPRAHADAVAEYLRQNQCKVQLVALDEKAVPAQSPDFLDQMERLASLRDRGMLTEAEFATKKAELLNSDNGATTPKRLVF